MNIAQPDVYSHKYGGGRFVVYSESSECKRKRSPYVGVRVCGGEEAFESLSLTSIPTSMDRPLALDLAR